MSQFSLNSGLFHNSLQKTEYKEFQESLTNDLVTATGSEADTWTLLSDTITNCTEQKKFSVF